MKNYFLGLLITLIIMGCSKKNVPTISHTEQSTSLTETYWKLTELMGQPVVNNGEGNKEMHIIIKGEGNRVNGNGGCNSFMGSYTLKEGNRISFAQLAGTLMACPNMEKERAFMEVFQKADNYAISGKQLSLNKARMAPLARFEAVYMR